jgi:hypothetical protein
MFWLNWTFQRDSRPDFFPAVGARTPFRAGGWNRYDGDLKRRGR